MNELDSLRDKIDSIDSELTALFLRRMELSAQVGEYKAARGLPVLDAAREEDVLKNRAALAPAHGDEIIALYRAIMAISRRRQRRLTHVSISLPPPRTPPEHPRILYQGEPGAYAGEAGLRFFGPQSDLRAVQSWEDIFSALQSGQADYGVLPIENSSTGGIAQVYDLLAKYNCFIVGEHILHIRHCLMGIPGASIADVREVCSHEQGLMQCRAFLNQHPDWKQTARPNTAESAKYVAARGVREQAVICSYAAGALYGLSLLRPDISDADENYTRFVVVSPRPEPRAGSNKISAVVTLPHQCGSLHALTRIFAEAGLNLLKLESRPVPGRSWEYLFFVDFSGNLSDPGMDAALEDLSAAAVSFRLLGNYPEGGA